MYVWAWVGMGAIWKENAGPCHAPKSECVDFSIYIQKKHLWEGKKLSATILMSSLVFVFSLPKEFHQKIVITSFLCHSHNKTRWTMSVNNVGFKLCLLGTSNFMITLTFFPWCKPKWSRTTSTTTHKIYRTLERLYGPWCKQPLMADYICVLSYG